MALDSKDALSAFSALSQDTRLAAFRLLVKAEPDGLPAGDISRRLNVPQNTMSAHLSVLAGAGMITSQRSGRSIIYRADLTAMRALTAFLLEDCCRLDKAASEPALACLSAAACETDTQGACK